MGGLDKFYRDTRDTIKVIPLPTPPPLHSPVDK